MIKFYSYVHPIFIIYKISEKSLQIILISFQPNNLSINYVIIQSVVNMKFAAVASGVLRVYVVWLVFIPGELSVHWGLTSIVLMLVRY